MFSAKRTISDLRVFSRGYLRNKFGLFFGLIFPVILILIFGAIFSGNSSGTITVYVQNQDTGPFPTQSMDVATSFIDALNHTGTVNVQLVSPSENFSRYLADHSSSDGIIIPANFSADYLASIPINVTVYGNPSASSSAIVSGTVIGLANEFNLRRFNGSSIIGLTQTTVNTEQTKYVDFLIPGLVGFSILVSPMFSLVNISSEYKKIKLFKQLSLTPLTKMEWLASKVLFYIVLSAVSFLLMVAVGVFAFGAHVTLTVWLIPFLILGPMLFASLGMLVGTVTKNPETAGVVGNIVTFPMMFLSGTFFPISIMPQYLQSIAHVLPLYYIIEGLNAVMVYANYAQALLDIAVVTVITIVLFVAAAKVFKWRE
ncbi:ABC transporter permease [Candidatus Bathyarchaeota archaeon A05DMB-2]|jgi:ABC-2 type transport system permease protein|nr:ABC transporter permease [Candidatus Bathyarchaeota archaeon A05DMB-2]